MGAGREDQGRGAAFRGAELMRGAAVRAVARAGSAPVCAIVAAGGTGSRFGNPGGKQLVSIAGRPMLAWTLAAFDRSAYVGHIVVVAPRDRAAEMRAAAVEPYGLKTPVAFAFAGGTRQDSTASGLAAVPEEFGFVAIHDGARPLITADAIDRAVETLLADPSLDGVVCGQPAIDTLKIAEGQRIQSTPPRSLYWTVQTPQIFSVDVMRRAQEAAEREGFVGTDDSSLVERLGGNVALVQCARDNLKVTVPEDLRPVEAILLGRMADAAALQDSGVIGRAPLG